MTVFAWTIENIQNDIRFSFSIFLSLKSFKFLKYFKWLSHQSHVFFLKNSCKNILKIYLHIILFHLFLKQSSSCWFIETWGLFMNLMTSTAQQEMKLKGRHFECLDFPICEETFSSLLLELSNAIINITTWSSIFYYYCKFIKLNKREEIVEFQFDGNTKH